MRRGRPVTLSDDDLLAVAQTVFLEQGLDATTAEIARRAQISESVIFHRYKTKEALFLAVLERQLELTPALIALSARAGTGELAKNLSDLGKVLITRMRTTLPFVMLAFSSPLKMTVLHEQVRRAHPTYFRLLHDYFAAERKAGRLGRHDPSILAHTYFGGLREYVFMELFAAEGEPVRLSETKFLRGLIKTLLHGIEQPSTGPARRRRPKG